MSEFSIRSMKKTIKGETDKRVSEDAAKELGNLVENYGREISEDAREIAKQEDRITVRDSDIIAALRNRGDL